MGKIDGFQQLDAWQEAHAQKELLAQAETVGKILNGLIASTERRRAAPLLPTPYSLLPTPYSILPNPHPLLRGGNMQPKLITLTINGRTHQVALKPNVTLLHALRDLGYTDVKNGCEKGDCGACAVLLNGRAVNSCLVLAWQADGAEITTAAGLGTVDHPHPIQEALADSGGVQCGFCIPGIVVSAKALLDRNPNPTEEEIREAISGNLCRCTGYALIVEGIRRIIESKKQ